MGHISANFIEYPQAPAAVHGAHHKRRTYGKSWMWRELIPNAKFWAAARDDAVGEAYDKVARVLGLGLSGRSENRQNRKGRKS